MNSLRIHAAAVLAALAFAAPVQAQPADAVDRLTPLVVKSMPIGDVFQPFIERDPNWPLAEKASRVSPTQLQCLRQRLSPAGYAEQRRTDVQAFVKRYPEKVSDSLRVLEDGAAEMFGASVALGAEQSRTGKKSDFNELAKRFTPAQLAAFVELVGDDKHRALRELIGIDDTVALEKSTEENQSRGRNKGQMIGVKLMLGAMSHCQVSLGALQ